MSSLASVSPPVPPGNKSDFWQGFVWGLVTTLIIVAVLFLLNRGGPRGTASAEPADCPVSGDPDIVALLLPIREQFGVPAITAAIVTGDGLQRHAVVGVRKRGTDVAATLEDAWHLGSNTKAMTAALTAVLVENGTLRWESTVAEVFPDLAESLPAAARDINFLHLLSHRAGVPENLSLRKYAGDAVRELRLRAVREELGGGARPGAAYSYSNLGYILAGAMLERVADAAWEDLVREHVFGPLGMDGAGFGGVGTPGEIDQPWGHGDNGRPVSGNGPAVDNPPVLGPAGRVHAPIQDWAKFIADQLRGATQAPALLSAASYTRLHTPPAGSEYALGWLVLSRDWGGGTVLHHAGSNTMNFSNVWIAPARNVAFLVCINQGGDTAFQASDQAVSAMIAWYDANAEAVAE